MLRIFWEGHDPTQGMRQGNNVGTQYRSAIYWHDERQRDAAVASREMFQAELTRAGHQQYRAANPNGYCGLGGTGVACRVGAGVTAD